ncbi:MAG: DegQ family serine endoprotease [Alphaproteobacteria bacterium]|jgi:serine protease Do
MQPETVVRKRIPGLSFRLGASLVAGSVIVWSGAASAALPAEGFADLVEKVSPAVVNISTTQKVAAAPGGEGGDAMPFPKGSPFEDFFRNFGDRYNQSAPQQAPAQALGSGFIVDADGYVVTNNHVIEQASKVRVNLSDGRSFDARVIGTDPKTDLALLRIKADKDLPYVSFGDSDAVRVGHPVVAVGNPFGLGGTVTAGIVSARGRNINAGPYDDFLQTDAAINRGNSGGPMFNADGEVIGINTAIFSPTGGSVGIGFAIPSNLAGDVIAQIKEHGSVERGWLGVQIQPVTPEIAEALGLDEAHGALVAAVTPDSPAAEAGLERGDVIVGFDGREVGDMQDLPRMVAAVRAGTEVEVAIRRDGDTLERDVTIGKLAADKVAMAPARDSDETRSEKLGATLSALTDEARQALGLAEDVEGVVVTGVDPQGPAAEKGLRPGDVIEQVDGRKVGKPADVTAAVEDRKSEKAVLLLVNREGNALFVGIRPKAV